MEDNSVKWIITKDISVRGAADWVGFNIENLSDFSDETQKELKKLLITSIINDLDDEWDEKQLSAPRLLICVEI
jgi:hypothetical protein